MINNPEAKAKMLSLAQFCYEESEGRGDLFFEYSPFLNCIKIEAYAGGYEVSSTPAYSQWVSLDPYYDSDSAESIKQTILNHLDVD